MAKPNYEFEKRRRDQEKKRKKEEKKQRKAERARDAPAVDENGMPIPDTDGDSDDAEPGEPTSTPEG